LIINGAGLVACVGAVEVGPGTVGLAVVILADETILLDEATLADEAHGGFPDAAHCAAFASSNNFLNIFPPRATQKLAVWYGFLQLEQVLFSDFSFAAAVSDVAIRAMPPCPPFLAHHCSKVDSVSIHLRAVLEEKFWSSVMLCTRDCRAP